MKSKTTFKIYSYDELKIVEGRFDIQINDYSINKMNWKSSWQTILRSLEDGGLPVYNANFIRELIGAFFGAEFNYKVRVPKENRDLLDN
ncbi:MAG: hypothetical protein GY810_22290 [Aureispira sp.]|nr:hypothetical protein [Aureispira sp.]